MLKRLTLCTVAALVASSLNAIIPYPGPIAAKDGNGHEIVIRLHGDERFCWATDEAGNMLLREDAADGWRMASADEVAATRALAPSRAAAVNRIQVENSFPTRGSHKLLMLLVNFSNTTPTFSREDFDDYMNGRRHAGVGSFRDYYLENSYGALDIATTVTPWVSLPDIKNHYTIDNVESMIVYALQLLTGNGSINLADFDNDGDGVLDGLAVIHQGGGQEATGSASDIWSHSSELSGVAIDGIRLGRYTIEPETFGNTGRMSTIGVMCHEFGHNLGAPDFYDTDYEGSGGEFPGTGLWDLMGSGAWNGEAGNRPAAINMWQKIQFGWVQPIVLGDESVEVTAMEGSTFAPVAYRLNTTESSDYFIVENRQRQGEFDSALPGSGLLIYHANDELISRRIDANTLNALYPQALYTVCASAPSDPLDSSFSYGNLEKAPFGNDDSTEFSDFTVPSMRSRGGRCSYRSLTDIAIAADGTASFTYSRLPEPPAPADLRSSVSRGEVTLTWDEPTDDEIEAYNVYVDDTLIATVGSECSYVDRPEPASSLLRYEVDAVRRDGMLSAPARIDVRVPRNSLTFLSAESTLNRVDLKWETSSRLTRMADNAISSADFVVMKFLSPVVDFAHRFRVDDLHTFIGSKIRKIGFLPYMSPQEATYTVRVWEADADGANPAVVSERQVKELGTGIWNSVLLTKAVEIRPDHEYWIGVTIDSNTGVVEITADCGPVVAGYGNLCRGKDEDWAQYAEAFGNFHLYAELSIAEPTGSVDDDVISAAPDSDVDFFYPLAFRIYRDGQLLSTTTARNFSDLAASEGTHAYEVVSVYRGNNESAPVEATVSHVIDASITDIDCGSDNHQSATVYDLLGRMVSKHQLAPGHYFIVCDKKPVKRLAVE